MLLIFWNFPISLIPSYLIPESTNDDKGFQTFDIDFSQIRSEFNSFNFDISNSVMEIITNL